MLLTQLGPHQGNNRGGNSTSFPMYEDFREAFVDHEVAPPLPRVSVPYDSLPAGKPLFAGMFARFGMHHADDFDGRQGAGIAAKADAAADRLVLP